MRRRLRPFLLVTLVSFLLGLWLSLRNAEHDLLNRLRESPTLTILTDQPDWWKGVAHNAEVAGVAKIEIISPARRTWADVLNKKPARCHLVATKSYFLRHFANKKWLETMSDNSGWWDLLHPDFQDTPAAIQPHQYLPLLWSVTAWQTIDPSPQDGRLELKTSLDDALLLAIDLHESNDEFSEADQIDNQETAEQLWESSKEDVSFAINEPATNVPLKPVKAVQSFVTEAREKEDVATTDKKFNFNDLWTWGIGVCPGHQDEKALKDFITWLLESDNIAVMATDSDLASTLMSSEHGGEHLVKPSNLRSFNLERLRRRELSWDLAAAWEDLFSAKPNNSPAKR